MTRSDWRADVRAALPGWLAGRALVGVAWLVALALVEVRLDGMRPITTAQGLFAWDGAYYRDIAVGGYDAVDPGAIRFHPLLPLLGRSGWGVLVVANVGALVAGAVVHRAAVVVTRDADLARRAATLVGIAPPAFCAAWAYAEGPFLAAAAGQLLAVQRRRWWAAAACGAVATLFRPTGVLLLVPLAVVAWRARPTRSSPVSGRPAWRSTRPGVAVAALGPVLAMGGYLAWVGSSSGAEEWYSPLEIQADLRGGTVFPLFRLVEGLGEVVADPFGDGLHVPFAAVAIALAWVACRRLPAEWAALAVVGVVVNLSADNLNSSERYAYGLVPVLVALAAVTGGRRWRPAVAASSVLFVGMAALAWYGRYVP